MSLENSQSIKQIVIDLGADLVGIADTNTLKGLKTDPGDLLNLFDFAISIAIQLPLSVFEMISDRPTPIYNAVYQTANQILDQTAFRISTHLQNDGFKSFPIPASQVVDRKNWYGAISHKAVARMAGIGWQGKNLLLITPEYGSRVRLVTVLTDAPLNPDKPLKNRCGKCMECHDACPVSAIKGIGTKEHYQNRNQAMHFDRCVKKLTQEFAQLPDIGTPICGICIKACPFTKITKKAKESS